MPVTAKEAEASKNKMKNIKGDINERNRGRGSNPQCLYDTLISGNHLPILRPLFSILDTTILTDYRYSAHQDCFD